MHGERFESFAFSDSGFIFDPATGSLFNSSVIGLEIIDYLKTGNTGEEIVQLLFETYEVSQEELGADLDTAERGEKTDESRRQKSRPYQ